MISMSSRFFMVVVVLAEFVFFVSFVFSVVKSFLIIRITDLDPWIECHNNAGLLTGVNHETT